MSLSGLCIDAHQPHTHEHARMRAASPHPEAVGGDRSANLRGLVTTFGALMQSMSVKQQEDTHAPCRSHMMALEDESVTETEVNTRVCVCVRECDIA